MNPRKKQVAQLSFLMEEASEKKNKKEVAYIAHPIGGNVKSNIKKILKIVRDINLNEPGVIPFVPYLADVMALDDNIEAQRERGLQNDFYYILHKVPTVIRLYGPRISAGMTREIYAAISVDIPIRPMTKQTIKEWEDKTYLNAE